MSLFWWLINIFFFTLSHIQAYNVLSLLRGLMAKAPIFTSSKREDSGVIAEATSIHRKLWILAWLILWFRVLVPDDVLAITSYRAKCIVLLVKRNTVHSIDISITKLCIFLSMALEAEVFMVFLAWIVHINVHYATSSFNTANCVSFTVGEGANWAGRIFQWTLSYCNRSKIFID